MHQELFRIPGIDHPVSSYGLMVMLGFLGAIMLARFLARRSRIDPELFVNCALVALVSGIGGARLSHVVENFSNFTRERVAVYPRPAGDRTTFAAPKTGTYVLSQVDTAGKRTPVAEADIAENAEVGFTLAPDGRMVAVGGTKTVALADPASGKYVWDRSIPFKEGFLAAVNITSGGLTFYGGFIVAFLCTLTYAIYRKMPIRRAMDIVAPCVMVGLSLGRVGCFLNGCCEGGRCDLPAPVAVEYPYNTNPYRRHLDEGTLSPDRVPPVEAQARSIDGKPIPLSREEVARRFANQPEIRSSVIAQISGLRSERVFNAQLASTITAALIALLLVGYYSLPHAPGRVMALMLMVEAPTRFVLEMMRAEPAFIGPGSPGGTLAWLPFDLSYSMFISTWLFVIGVVLWYVFRGPPDDMSQPELPANARLATA